MLGDVIKKITNKLGFKTCEACEKRRKELNFAFTWLRYRLAKKIKSHRAILIRSYLNKSWTLNEKEKKEICKMYANTFNIEYYQPNLYHISPFITMLERLEKVIKLQEKKQ